MYSYISMLIDMLVEIKNLFKAEFAKTTMKAHTGDVIYKIYTAFFL